MFAERAWGVYGKYNDRPCIWVVEEKMKEMAASAGISSVKDIQKELADRGFLVRDKSNHYRFDKTVESGIEACCYGIFLNSKSKEKACKTAKIITADKSNECKSSQLQELLTQNEEE